MSWNPFTAVGNLINSAADYLAGSSVGKAVNNAIDNTALGANISSASTTPVPYLPPTPYSGAGPGGSQPAVVPNKQVTSGPYQNFSVNPNAVPAYQNPTNQSVVPNQSTPYGPAQGGTLTYPNSAFPNPSGVPTVFNGPLTPIQQASVQPINQNKFGYTIPVGTEGVDFTTVNNHGVVSYQPIQAPTGGFAQSGFSSGQFGGGSNFNISPIAVQDGGASLLPGSLAGVMRSASFPFTQSEEDKKKKTKLVSVAENKPFVGPFDQILQQQQLQANMSGGGTGNPLNIGNNNQQTPIALQPGFNSANVPLGGFLGGSSPINGKLTFQNGQFGTMSNPNPGIQVNGGQNQDVFTPIHGVPFSQSDQNIINGVSSKTPIYPTPTGAAIPSVQELVNKTSTDVPINVGTQSDTLNTITSRTSQVIGTLNQVNAQNTEDTLKNTTLDFMSKNSVQLFGQQLTPDQVWNAMNGPGADKTGQIRDAYAQVYAKAKDGTIDPATGQPYQKDWTDPSTYEKLYTEGDPKLTELKNLKQQLEDIKATDPYASQTVQDFANSVYKDQGVLSTRALIKQKEDSLNAITGVYEGLSDEIRNDPDFSKKLKANRLKFLNDEQVRQSNVLQRSIDSLNEDLKFKLEYSNNLIKNAADQYTVYVNERNFIQNNMNTINTQIEKASDNARAVFNTIVANPDLIKGATQTDLDREYATIQNLGYIPISMITRLAANTGKDVKSVVTGQTSSTTKTVYGLDSNGKVVYSFTMPDVSQSGGNSGLTSGISTALYADIARYQTAIAAINNDNSLDPYTKEAQKQTLIGQLMTKYGTNSTAMSIVDKTFTNPQTSNSLNYSATTAQYDTDLSSELATINSLPWWNPKGNNAQEAKNRLLAKYPNQTQNINAAFKQYGI